LLGVGGIFPIVASLSFASLAFPSSSYGPGAGVGLAALGGVVALLGLFDRGHKVPAEPDPSSWTNEEC
jgi:hypothetical protein